MNTESLCVFCGKKLIFLLKEKEEQEHFNFQEHIDCYIELDDLSTLKQYFILYMCHKTYHFCVTCLYGQGNNLHKFTIKLNTSGSTW